MAKFEKLGQIETYCTNIRPKVGNFQVVFHM